MDEVDASGAVACPVPAGGASIHLSRMFHYAGPNRTDEARYAYVLAFGTPASERETARDFYWLRTRKSRAQERAKAHATKQGGPGT